MARKLLSSYGKDFLNKGFFLWKAPVTNQKKGESEKK